MVQWWDVNQLPLQDNQQSEDKWNELDYIANLDYDKGHTTPGQNVEVRKSKSYNAERMRQYRKMRKENFMRLKTANERLQERLEQKLDRNSFYNDVNEMLLNIMNRLSNIEQTGEKIQKHIENIERNSENKRCCVCEFLI